MEVESESEEEELSQSQKDLLQCRQILKEFQLMKERWRKENEERETQRAIRLAASYGVTVSNELGGEGTVTKLLCEIAGVKSLPEIVGVLIAQKRRIAQCETRECDELRQQNAQLQHRITQLEAIEGRC